MIDTTYNNKSYMQPPRSTVDNSLPWRVWHGTNYLIGGITFLLGSVALFTFVTDALKGTIDTASASAWLYTIGSAAFLLADITQWIHYFQKDCKYMIFVLNFFVSVCGSLLYLIGSICFIPSVNQSNLGMQLFIYGSALIVISQTWKLIRSLRDSNKSCRQCYNQDPSGFYVDLFAGLGGLGYFVGTFVFYKALEQAQLNDWGALIYTIGGLFFLLSGIFMQKRYYCESKKDKAYQYANSLISN